MERNTKGNMTKSLDNDVVEEYRFGQMDQDMKGIGNLTKQMDNDD